MYTSLLFGTVDERFRFVYIISSQEHSYFKENEAIMEIFKFLCTAQGNEFGRANNVDTH